MLVTHGAPDQRIHMLTQQHDDTDADAITHSDTHPSITLDWSIRAHRIAYSASALMIRALRAQLHGRPLSTVTPDVFARAAVQVKQMLSSGETDDEGITDVSRRRHVMS